VASLETAQRADQVRPRDAFGMLETRLTAQLDGARNLLYFSFTIVKIVCPTISKGKFHAFQIWIAAALTSVIERTIVYGTAP
jgi:hypothetical protein